MSSLLKQSFNYYISGTVPEVLRQLDRSDFEEITKIILSGTNINDVYASDCKTLHIKRSTLLGDESPIEFAKRNTIQILHILAEMYISKGMCICEIIDMICDTITIKDSIPEFAYLILKKNNGRISHELLVKLKIISTEIEIECFIQFQLYFLQECKENNHLETEEKSTDQEECEKISDKVGNELIQRIYNGIFISPVDFNKLIEFLPDCDECEEHLLYLTNQFDLSNVPLDVLLKMYVLLARTGVCQFDCQCIELVNAIDKFSIANNICWRTIINCSGYV